MARFSGGGPIGPTPGGGALGGAFPPAPQAGGPGGFGPRIASMFAPAGNAGHPTLQALMERQQELANRKGGAPQIQSWTQGAAHMLDKLFEGLEVGRTNRRLAEGNQVVSDVLSQADPVTGELTPAQIAPLAEWDPDRWAQLMQVYQSGRNVEMWEDIAAPDGAKPGQLYQRNSQTGEVRTAGGGSGTEVTINPPSAETGAKLGLAQGFFDNYDDIVAAAQAGEMTGGGYFSGVQLGRGAGGIAYRNLLQGTEAMVRLLTGAGMNENEARQRVTQYEPALTDDVPTLVSKIQGLHQALTNVQEGVMTRGQGEGEPGETPDETATESIYKVGEIYTFAHGKGKYLGGDIGDPASWELVP
jgi:hypothetical protein